MQHRKEFEEYHTSLPEVQEWMAKGYDVTEFFVTGSGVEHFCFQETRQAYAEWLKSHKGE